MTKNLLAVSLIAWVGVGCTYTNVPAYKIFAPEIGRTIPLTREMVLSKEGRGMWSLAHVPRLRASYVLLETNIELYPSDQFVAKLPVGHPITLTSVRDEIIGDDSSLIAYGNTYIPGSKKEMKLAYLWGSVRELNAAPWESTNTPSVRKLDWPIRPHGTIPFYHPVTDRP
jgi:hypothetical protein